MGGVRGETGGDSNGYCCWTKRRSYPATKRSGRSGTQAMDVTPSTEDNSMAPEVRAPGTAPCWGVRVGVEG